MFFVFVFFALNVVFGFLKFQSLLHQDVGRCIKNLSSKKLQLIFWCQKPIILITVSKAIKLLVSQTGTVSNFRSK
jgi:hypothetical protein